MIIEGQKYWFEVEAEERGRAEGEARGRTEGRNDLLYQQVRDGIISLRQAAQYAHISESEFEKNMRAFRAVQSAKDAVTSAPNAE